MSEQEVGMGVAFPSVKKGMVAPVDRQKSGADASGLRWPGGSAAPGAWLKALGDMVTGGTEGSCWEWLLVGSSSLSKPPAQSSPSSGSSSAGGALGATARAGFGPAGTGAEGDRLTGMFPMKMGRVTTASGDFSDTWGIHQEQFKTILCFF